MAVLRALPDRIAKPKSRESGDIFGREILSLKPNVILFALYMSNDRG